jgi:hypothetical protein
MTSAPEAKGLAGPETQLLALVACNDFGAAMRLNEETAAKMPLSANVERFFVKTIAEQWPQARAEEPWTAAKLDSQVQRERDAALGGLGKAFARSELQPRVEAQPGPKAGVPEAGERPFKLKRLDGQEVAKGPAPRMRLITTSGEAAKLEEAGPPKLEVAPKVSENAAPENAAPEKEPELKISGKALAGLTPDEREEVLKRVKEEIKSRRPQQPVTFQHSKSPAGVPSSLANAQVAFKELGVECRYDLFHDKIIVAGYASMMNGDAQENLDNLVLMLRDKVLGKYGFDPSSGFMQDALRIECMKHIFDPVRDYLDTLAWDGMARLDRWLIDYCRAADTPLNRAFSRKVLVAAVRRVRSPGCKFDFIVVLEGPQGIGKSSLLKILAGEENFSDNEILGLDKREQQEAVQGVWIYELCELDGLSKSEVTAIKLFASKTIDSARPAFGRSRVDRRRRLIFIATTNEDTYLRDTTGNRRFWPVKVGKINLDGIARDRDQLWAEAAAAEASGEPLTIPEELWGDAAIEQKARMNQDAWEEIVSNRLAGLRKNERLMDGSHVVDGSFGLATDESGGVEWRVSTNFLLTEVLDLPKERQGDAVTKRLASIMRSLGWTRPSCAIRIGKAPPCRGFVLAAGALQGEILPPPRAEGV